MARKKKNTVDYFPHLIHDGKSMFIIESKYKNDGYATRFKILERLGKSENHFINLKDSKESMFLASRCHIEEQLLEKIIADLVDLDKFDKELWEDHKVIWSQSFVDNIADAYKRRDSELPTINSICQQLSIKYQHKYISEGETDIQKSPYNSIVDNSIVDNSIVDNTKQIPPNPPAGGMTEPLQIQFSYMLSIIDLYPGRARDAETELDNLKKKHKDWKEVLANRIYTSIENEIVNKRVLKQRVINHEPGAHLPPWKNFQTWINNRCWEIDYETTGGKSIQMHE